jgi:hypothetical protein
MKRKAKKTPQRAARRAASHAAKRTSGRNAAQKSVGKLKASRTKKAVTKKTQTAPHDPLDALVEASAKALGLPLDPAWHAGVKFNLQLILRHAALVEEFSLPDDAEPAPVYHA